MPPANVFPITIRPRSLANVLSDIKEAKGDHETALEATSAALAKGDFEAADDADDRATEAETRLEDLRQDFEQRIKEATGLTIEDLRDAWAGALI